MSSVLLEVCLDSAASAIASQKGGAQRVELCSDLEMGGVTPNADLIAAVRSQISIAVHILVRPRTGDFCYTPEEFDIMKREIGIAKQLGANGVALGVLNRDSLVDVPRTRELVELARPLSVTFHRAFDVTANLIEALEDVVRTGADRVLTSGGKPTAVEGRNVLARLVQESAGRVGILACGTIRQDNVASIIKATGVREVHARLQTPERDMTEVQAETVVQFLTAAHLS